MMPEDQLGQETANQRTSFKTGIPYPHPQHTHTPDDTAVSRELSSLRGEKGKLKRRKKRRKKLFI